MPFPTAPCLAPLLLTIVFAGCGTPRTAGVIVAKKAAVPSPAAAVTSAARRFSRQFARGSYGAQWRELAPEAQASWPSAAARSAMLRVKFGGLRVIRVRVGRPRHGTPWQSLENPRLHISSAWTVPIAVTFAGTLQPSGVAVAYGHLSLSLVIRRHRALVVGEGPASLDAPVIVPRRAVQARVHVPILMYHRVAPLPLPSQWTNSYGYAIEYGLTVPPQQFAAEMGYLANRHYAVISLARLADALLYGLPLPARSVVLTFDDGRASPWRYAVPVLRRDGFTAVFFPCAGLVGQTVETRNHLDVQHYLSWTQIRQLTRMGFWIEDHGQKDQQVLWQLTPAQLRSEAGASAQQLSAVSGEPVQFVAYTGALWPYPLASEVGPQQLALFRQLARLGYVGGVTDTRISSATETARSLWHLPRIRVSPGETPAGFAAALQH
ncbi:MAG TPA: polysaccharide deacetylase family protein [Chloroflexota bacterium]|nr:polysaccharide deacetylase family protein [Chloroflexota bacterium]